MSTFLYAENVRTNVVYDKQECIPVGCVPPTIYHTGGSPWTETPLTETPLDRDPSRQRPPDRDPLDRDPWTETPLDWDPLPLDRSSGRVLNIHISVRRNVRTNVVYKQECIPVGCVLFTLYHIEGSHWTKTLWTETPRQRPPGQRPPGQTPLDRGTLGLRPPPIGQRPPWTKTPQTEAETISLDKDSLDREPPGLRHPWTETPSPRQSSKVLFSKTTKMIGTINRICLVVETQWIGIASNGLCLVLKFENKWEIDNPIYPWQIYLILY